MLEKIGLSWMLLESATLRFLSVSMTRINSIKNADNK